MKKIKIELPDSIHDWAKEASQEQGYSSLQEFLLHVLEKQYLQDRGSGEGDQAVEERLKGLGYI